MSLYSTAAPLLGRVLATLSLATGDWRLATGGFAASSAYAQTPACAKVDTIKAGFCHPG